MLFCATRHWESSQTAEKYGAMLPEEKLGNPWSGSDKVWT